MELFKDVRINVESVKSGASFIVHTILKKFMSDDADKLAKLFIQKYDKLLMQYAEEDITDYLKLRRLIVVFKPALASVLEPGEVFDLICDAVSINFNSMLASAKRQIKGEVKVIENRKPILPGSDPSVDLMFFCTECKEKFEIPADLKTQLLDSSDGIELPKHHEKEMIIIIIKAKPEVSIAESGKELKSDLDESQFSADHVMGNTYSSDSNVDYLEVLSVGIDIGSSTSHLVFSKLTLKREQGFFNMSNRFIPISRKVIYEGNIIFTPLLDRNTIDIDAIIKFIHDEFKKARIDPSSVDTGAVIVTGEASKKQNAAEIVNKIATEAGKFVSATAGPNFEAFLSAKGSGAIGLSQNPPRTILNVDVGGGSSKLSIISKGKVLSTAAISVGARLLGINKKFKIWKIDDPCRFVLEELGFSYQVGDIISEAEVKIIAKRFAEILIEVMRGSAKSDLSKRLMITEDLEFFTSIAEYSFSGGVSELIYGSKSEFDDIGKYLAEAITTQMKELNMKIIESMNKIRATVIGAGAYSLSISGSTCFVSNNIKLPLLNIPVLPVNVSFRNFSREIVKTEIQKTFKNFDFIEGEDLVALYFIRPVMSSSEKIIEFAKAIEEALPNSIAKKKKMILLFEMDGARIIGTTFRNHTAIQDSLICLDELTLEAGDWIDIGAPLHDGDTYPVTVKSLVFKR
ncbi:MAG: ethanolamine ammonia-lyase reactivating factor EutA [Candidatus Hermodarchaeota archaeon]